MEETITYPAGGRHLDNSAGRIEDVSDEQQQEDKQRDDDAAAQYEERMEEEYAKREGGA